MKILMVNKFLYPRGGAETYMLKIGGHLAEMGHEVQYFGMYDEKNTVGNSAGIYTGNMDFHSKSISRLLYPFRILYSLEARKRIRQVLEDFQPDVVHLNNINFQLTPSILDAIHSSGIPVVQTVHDYQMVCPNHLLYNLEHHTTCERCIQGSKWNCARYKCIHSSRVKSILGTMEALLYRRHKAYTYVDKFICPSRFLESRLLAGDRRFAGKTAAIHNYIEIPDLQEQKDRGYIAFAGRLSMEKGVRLLAEAARKLPEYKFVVMGRGDEAEQLQNIPNVELAGFLTGEAFIRTMSQASTVVVPSICYENCPLSILEAQAMGVPVVTMNAGGMAELVDDQVTGLLVDRADADALADTIREMMRNPERRAKMKENCLSKRDEMITLETYCQKLVEIYAEVRGCRE